MNNPSEMGMPAMPVTASFWFRLPDSQLWSEARFTHPSELTAKAIARRHWDNLKSLNYVLAGRP